MDAKWILSPSEAAGVRQAPISFAAGQRRYWTVNVPGKDLTGWTATWFLGIPPNPERLGIDNLPYSAPKVVLTKSSAAGNLGISVANGSSKLVFTLVRLDTILLPGRPYWQQSVVFDPSGEPEIVEEGPLYLGGSLFALPPSS